MIERPKIIGEQQKQLRYDVIKRIEEYHDPEQLDDFSKEWDGTVNFKIMNDHTVIASIAGEEKLPDPLKEEIRGMLHQFNIETTEAV